MASGARKIGTIRALEELGRIRLPRSFFKRDFLPSEIVNFFGMPNVPDDPKLAIHVGQRLCEELLEPCWSRSTPPSGRIAVRSAYRSPTVNALGNEKGHNCASIEKNYASHIWGRRDAAGFCGATAYRRPVVRRSLCRGRRLAIAGLLDPRPPALLWGAKTCHAAAR